MAVRTGIPSSALAARHTPAHASPYRPEPKAGPANSRSGLAAAISSSSRAVASSSFSEK